MSPYFFLSSFSALRKAALFAETSWTRDAVEMVSTTIYKRGVEPAPEQLSRRWIAYLAERAEDEEGEGQHLDLHFRPICGQPRGIQPVCGWEDLWTRLL